MFQNNSEKNPSILGENLLKNTIIRLRKVFKRVSQVHHGLPRTKAHTFLCTALFTKNTTTSDQNDLHIA